jgi:HEAT repeats
MLCRPRGVGRWPKMRKRIRALLAVPFLALAQCGREPDAPAAQESPAPSVPTGNANQAGPGGRALRGATPDERPIPSGFPVPAEEAREFDVLSDEQRAGFGRLRDEFFQTQDRDRRLEILDEIAASFYGEEVIALAGRVFALGDEALNLRMVEMLAGNTSAAIIPLLETVLRDPSEQVRTSAVLAVGQVRDDSVVGYLAKVFEDESADVRLTGLNVLEEQTENRRLKVLDRALEATHPDVQSAAITALQVESTPKSVEVLFNALGAADPEVREEARFSIDFMLDKEFATADEARAWWKENKNKFDQDLAPTE